MGIFELRHIFGQIPSLVNRQIPSCSRLYFKASVSAKLLTWNDLILIKKKTHFQKKGFERALDLKVRDFETHGLYWGWIQHDILSIVF